MSPPRPGPRPASCSLRLRHGLNPSANIIDELHAHRDGALYTALTGILAREQPFTLWITAAGATDAFLYEMVRVMADGPGELEERGALRIYRDRVNGTLIYGYAAPEGADIEDPQVWRACNPASWLQDGKVLGSEIAHLKARGALVEWRTYDLDQFVEQLERWMREADWDAGSGDPVFNPQLPVCACVRVAHDHRSAAVAIAQRQSEKVMLRVRCHPEQTLAEGDYVDAGSIERHITELRQRYSAPVTAEVTYHAGG